MPTCPTHTVSPSKYVKISSHSAEVACGSWKTHLPVLACGESVRCQAERTEVILMWEGGCWGGDGECRWRCRCRENSLCTTRAGCGCVWSISMQTDSPTCLTANHVSLLLMLWYGGGEGGSQQHWKHSIYFSLCRSLHLHCSVSPSFALLSFRTLSPSLDFPAVF